MLQYLSPSHNRYVGEMVKNVRARQEISSLSSGCRMLVYFARLVICACADLFPSLVYFFNKITSIPGETVLKRDFSTEYFIRD
jgi:hypothetical protein